MGETIPAHVHVHVHVAAHAGTPTVRDMQKKPEPRRCPALRTTFSARTYARLLSLSQLFMSILDRLLLQVCVGWPLYFHYPLKILGLCCQTASTKAFVFIDSCSFRQISWQQCAPYTLHTFPSHMPTNLHQSHSLSLSIFLSHVNLY